jgi:hypothetical protein
MYATGTAETPEAALKSFCVVPLVWITPATFTLLAPVAVNVATRAVKSVVPVGMVTNMSNGDVDPVIAVAVEAGTPEAAASENALIALADAAATVTLTL